MKMKQFFTLLIVTLLFTCTDSDRPRFVVKKTQLNGKETLEWYNYSNISSFGPDRVDFCDADGNRKLIYKCNCISDIGYDSINKTINISWWLRQQVEPFDRKVNDYIIRVDSAGCSLMSSDARRNKNWNENICIEKIKLIEYEREHHQ